MESDNLSHDEQTQTNGLLTKSNLKKIGLLAGQLALGVGISYVASFINTAIHELGHAFTAQYFNGSPIAIALGGTASAGMIRPGIHFTGFDSLRGQALVTLFDNWTDVGVSLAGPCAGIVGAMVERYVLKKQQVLPKLTTEVCLLNNDRLLMSNFSQLIPYKNESDGGQIAERLNLIQFNSSGLPSNPPIAFLTSSLEWLSGLACPVMWCAKIVGAISLFDDFGPD